MGNIIAGLLALVIGLLAVPAMFGSGIGIVLVWASLLLAVRCA